MEVDQAIAEVADIRSRLAAATRFHGYAPGAVGTIGVLSLTVTVAQVAWPEQFASSDRQIVLIWGALMATGLCLIAFEAALRARRDADQMARSLLVSAMRIVVPCTIITAVIPAAVLIYAPTIAWIVPGIWQMLVGVVAFASYASLPRRIVWPGAWYLISGALGLFMAGHHGSLSPLLAGVPFVVGHFGIAWTLIEEEQS